MRSSLGRLRELVVEQGDLLLFDEASRCLLAGANRAAYIMAWLSAAASIRSKLEALAPRDSSIGRKLSEIEEAEAKGTPVDRMLLQAAKDFGMISAEDHDNLENIRRMRNIYAHPRKSSPTYEEVLGALATVCRSLLSRAALLRHGYASDVLRGVFEERHFLDDLPDRVIAFGRDVANRTDPQIHPWIFQSAVGKLDAAWADPSLARIVNRGLAFLKGFLYASCEDLGTDAWAVVQTVREHPACIPSVLGDAELWEWLPEQAREITIGYLTSAIARASAWPGRLGSTTPGPLPSQAYEVLHALEVRDALSPRERERLAQAIQLCSVERLAEFGVPIAQWAPQVIESLKSYSWYTQNPAVNALRQAGPQEIANLPSNMQEQLGRNVLQAAEGMSNSAEALFSDVAHSPAAWPLDFHWGLLAECFTNDAGHGRIKARMLSATVRSVCSLTLDHAMTLLHRLNESLAAATPKDGRNGSVEFGAAAAVLREMQRELDIEENSDDARIADSLQQTVQHLERLHAEATSPN